MKFSINFLVNLTLLNSMLFELRGEQGNMIGGQAMIVFRVCISGSCYIGLNASLISFAD